MAELVVGLENNQKILIPTSSEARSGNPLGTILAIHSNVVPYGYLPCNGVAFDEHQYPALYALLGDNHTPVEGHTLDWDNAESITLSTSDYVVQKNGLLVGYTLPTTGYSTKIIINNIPVATGAYVAGGYISYNQIQIPVQKGDIVKCDYGFTEQFIKLIPYKYYKVIKATSGLEETQQDYVLQSLLEADSYSTEEVATGKKWIDGKMIYRRVINTTVSGGYNTTTNGYYSWESLGFAEMSTFSVSTMIDAFFIGVGFERGDNKINKNCVMVFNRGANYNQAVYQVNSGYDGFKALQLVIEYTKAD